MKVLDILLIDDDIDDQEFFIDALKGINNAVLGDVANNGKEALMILQNRSVLPDIIFSDIHMPIMKGIECLSEISKCVRTKNIPVIMLSTDTTGREAVFGLGARAFIKKETKIKALHAQIAQLIDMNFTPGNLFANNLSHTNSLPS